MSVAHEHTSASAEHYTPRAIVEAARVALGGAVDLDPFSCALANRTVGAALFYSLAAGYDGFALPWHGRIFCNPPGGKHGKASNQKRAWFRLASEYRAGRVTAAIFVCFDLGLLQITQHAPPAGLALPLDFPICYPARRIAYLTDTLPGPTPKRPARKPSARQLEDHAETGLCDGEAPPHCSCVVGVGVDGEVMRAAFERVGRVVVPAPPGQRGTR